MKLKVNKRVKFDKRKKVMACIAAVLMLVGIPSAYLANREVRADSVKNNVSADDKM